MRKRLVAILSASFLLTVFGGFSCLGDSFRFFVHPDLKDGYYFLVDKSNVSPRYAVTVENGFVTSDDSDGDKFGCFGGRTCREQMRTYAGKNVYIYINSVQLMRLTPDDKRVVLSWFKDLD